MALQTNSRARASVPGVGRPFLRSKLPDTARGPTWRQTVANAYGELWANIAPEIPLNRDVRPRFGVRFGFGEGYQFGQGNPDPDYAQPSSLTNPYIAISDLTILPSQLTNAISRRSVLGVARPFMRTQYPQNEPDLRWRKTVGLTYAAIPAISNIQNDVTTSAPVEDSVASPTYEEESVF